MPPSYAGAYVSGIFGSLACDIGGTSTVLPCEWWDWDAATSSVPCMTLASAPYTDQLASKTVGALAVGGTWNYSFTPFGFVGTSSPPVLKLGQLVTNVIFQIKSGPGYQQVVATAPTARVARWHIWDNADGTAQYVCYMQASFVFTDFSQGSAVPTSALQTSGHANFYQ